MKKVIALSLLLAFSPAFAASKPAKAKKQTVKLDTSASVLKWTGRKITGSHDGTIKLKQGTVTLVNGAITGGELVVDMKSIENRDVASAEYKAKLVNHLKNDDFFSVDKFPTAKFKISAVEPLKEAKDGATHTITGDLTIKGITNAVSFPATVSVDGKTAQAKGTAIIDRTKWDIRYGSGKFFENLGDKTIHDDFDIEFQLSGKVK